MHAGRRRPPAGRASWRDGGRPTTPPWSTALRRAGAVGLGKTNMDEFAMGSSTENSAFGPTRNPRDTGQGARRQQRRLGRRGGGRASPRSRLGSDTGGSIRQPAALCGVVGMKPTYGRVSRYGLVAFASSLDQIGPFAATVEDAALLYDVLAGHDPLDSTSLPSAPEPTLPRCTTGSRACGSGCAATWSTAARPTWWPGCTRRPRRWPAAGAKVEEISVPEFAYGLSAYYLIAPAEASSNLARYDGVRYGLRVDAEDVAAMNTATRTAGFGPEVKRRIMLGTYALSAGYYDAYYAQAQRVRTLVMQAFDRAYDSFDVLLGATAPTTAFDARGQGGRPHGHVHERRLHHPLQPGGPPGRLGALRDRGRRPARRRAGAGAGAGRGADVPGGPGDRGARTGTAERRRRR